MFIYKHIGFSLSLVLVLIFLIVSSLVQAWTRSKLGAAVVQRHSDPPPPKEEIYVTLVEKGNRGKAELSASG
jgi:hypothetical protein